MAVLYENYNTGDDGGATCYGIYWKAQTFTPSINHTITSIKFKVYRVGSPGTVTVGIRATDGTNPTGDDLCSGTYNGNDFTTDAGGDWYEITFEDGYALSASTKYAIVARATSGNASNRFIWRNDGSSPAYTGGSLDESTDSGSTWSPDTNGDLMFEEWGEISFVSPLPTFFK